MATSTRLVLQPHLRERLAAAVPHLGTELRGEIEAVLAQPDPAEVEAQRAASPRPSTGTPEIDEKQVVLSDASEDSEWTEVVTRKEGSAKPERASKEEGTSAAERVVEEPEVVPPLVDVELLDQLSRWAATNEACLRKAGLGELT